MLSSLTVHFRRLFLVPVNSFPWRVTGTIQGRTCVGNTNPISAEWFGEVAQFSPVMKCGEGSLSKVSERTGRKVLERPRPQRIPGGAEQNAIFGG
jgi:hypothetical protein